MKNLTVNAIVRIVVTLIALLNAILTAQGANPIPFDETAFTEWTTAAAAGVAVVWSWWKDAPLTAAGKAGHAYMKAVKQDGIPEECGEEPVEVDAANLNYENAGEETAEAKEDEEDEEDEQV